MQGELERALGIVTRCQPPRLTVAGRTDAGVHATAQVAHADLPAGDPVALLRRLNALLDTDLRVWSASVAAAGFDARFSALSRTYRYRVGDAAYGVDPLRRHDTYAYARRLEADRMRAATSELLGEHDYAAYCRRRPGATTVRRLLRLDVDRAPDDVTVVTVEADAFCHSMVRALVGALLAVGSGHRPPEWPAEVLRRRERDAAVVVAPPHGLTLVEVRYPADADLAERAARTRRLRIQVPSQPT